MQPTHNTMQHVTATKVTAIVRIYGAIGKFSSREFTLMLGPGSETQRHREAIRILNQLGWETNGVNIEV